jgi:hypothetical protein
MKAVDILFYIPLALVVVAGCSDVGESAYPTRPTDTPYYYNETAATEMDESSRAVLRHARADTGVEFVMVLLNDIPDTIHVGDYAAGLFRRWDIGSKTGGKGVLILFVENDRTLKIEVSYDLEPVLTDAYCSSFQPTIKSYYAGRYFGHVFDGTVCCLVRRIVRGGDPAEPTLLDYAPADPEILKSSSTFLSGGGGITEDEYYYDKDVKLSFIVNIPAETVLKFDSSKDVHAVVERYLESLRQGINYPFLGILTEGSQLMRLEYPESPHFYRSRWHDCRRGFPFEVKVEGDLAAVRFSGDASFPIFLRRTEDGYWKVDAVRGWLTVWMDFIHNKSGPMLKDHPWSFAFPEYSPGGRGYDVPGLRPLSVNLKDEIRGLEAAIEDEPGNASNYFELADLFYWDCMWIAPAINLVERGLELEPDNIPYRWLAIDMRYRFPSPEPNEEHFEKLMALAPGDPHVLYRYSNHCWYYTLELKKATRLLRQAREADRRAGRDGSAFRRYWNGYKRTYWNEIAVDRNVIPAAVDYFYLFVLA